MSRINNIFGYYRKRLLKEEHSHVNLGWENQEAHLARFKVLLDNMESNHKSLLDVGCGLGDLYKLLSDHSITCEYTGVDILREMVEEAQRRYPDANFVHGDVFSQTLFPYLAFDIVYCSGVFNLNLGNNKKFLRRAFARFNVLSADKIIVNMLHERAQNKEAEYFYYDPEETAKLAESFTWKVDVIDDYLHNDFTLICEKKDVSLKENLLS